MKIKTYTALNVSMAMEKIRADFGDKALIVANHKVADGVKLTVAVDEENISDIFQVDYRQKISNVLKRHHLHDSLIEKIIQHLSGEDKNDELLLASALADVFRFEPLNSSDGRCFIFIGMPGVGKTLALAKTAVALKLKGKSICVISCDTKRAGGISQLSAFTDILKVPLFRAKNSAEIQKIITNTDEDVVLIDTFGVNFFQEKEIQDLKNLISGISAELNWVIPAGVDVDDILEITDQISSLNPVRIIGTRLDLSGRIGAILTAAWRGQIPLGDFSVSHLASDILLPADAKSLARMILSSKDK